MADEENRRTVIEASARFRRSIDSDHLKGGGGGGTFDGMEARIRDLEKGHAVVVERLNGLEKRMDDGFKAMGGRFDELNKKIDKLPNEWAMARVVFYVTAALMAAAVFGPRVIAAISN